ncbi:DMT family transporter [Thetidibacter halocola]|uniref:DMT family transporter n=1 Tax=Thetidibacter halocola TaxID=2827239 RepID=A0A8J8B973_9RHOB|nr:DMT family transporter [Thetidibacter halocola]MBS0125569.1 DMT family transporter [Thetidibacter halocola]
MTENDRPALGILFILIGTFAISVNDLLIKYLASDYPLHQMVFVRALIGLTLTLGLVMAEGGLHILRTSRPFLHLLRGVLVVLANLTYYAAFAVLPLGQVTALYFVAPLFITLLAIPVLGERIGAPRLIAVAVGFCGVLVMQQPWKAELDVSRVILLLPVLSAALYAFMQVLTRRLGGTSRASAMAVYIQASFVVVSATFGLVAGDGHLAEGITDESLLFILRPWIWPTAEDWPVFIGLGLCSGILSYCISAAYRTADAGLLAPFEYLGLAMAIFWGWSVFGEWPVPATWVGCVLIVGAGIFVFLRERKKNAPIPGRRSLWVRR